MRVLRGVGALPAARSRPALRGAVVTIGMFDGMHAAHQRLIHTTVDFARRLRRPSVVITFSPDPQVVLSPAQAPPALMPLDVRVRHLDALGVDAVWIVTFTRRFSRMTAERFLRRVVIERLRAAALVVGEEFMFGRDRQGSAALLRDVGAQEGLQVRLVRSIRRGGAPISSSRIRRLITAGHLADATDLLGHPPALYGRVVRGAGRATRLGFPTANLHLVPQALPPPGVYAVAVRGSRPGGCRAPDPAVDGRACWCHPRGLWGGAMNLGVRPTFGPGPMTCEVHLLDDAGRLRGHALELLLIARLRDERRFETPEALAAQVRRDITRARGLLPPATLRASQG